MSNRRTPRFDCVIDSGSPFCLFRAGIAAYLKIDLKAGSAETLLGVSDRISEVVYFHRVTLGIGTWEREVTAGFAENLAFPGLLGISGFFENFRVTFDVSGIPPHFEVTPHGEGG